MDPVTAMMKTFPLLAAGAALLAAAACTSSGSSGPITPDEFRVITKPPLSTPPNYSLRPPAPGTTAPAELDGGTVAAFGAVTGADASPAERALVAAAGANAVNPAVRAQVDYEETRAIRKPASVVDRVMFWRGDNPEDAESAMTDNATGNQQVTVEQGSGGRRIKLPGT